MAGMAGPLLKEERCVKMPEFQLTWHDMRAGLEATCEKYEAELAEFGIGKFIPPAGWSPRKAGYDDLDLLIPRPIRQNMTGGKGIFRSFLVEEKPLRLKDQFAYVATFFSPTPFFRAVRASLLDAHAIAVSSRSRRNSSTDDPPNNPEAAVNSFARPPSV
jgi:hypothetical protein